MVSKPLDFKKEYKDLYMPGITPVLVDVGAMNFIMVDGQGDPNSPLFTEAVELLYGLSFTIKMSKMKNNQPEGYYEYVVPPLEGLWWISGGGFSFEQRGNWLWTAMIRQPDFVTPDVFAWACQELRRKKPELRVENARLETFTEGLCVQAMHIGPYATEPETMLKLEAYMAANNLKDMVPSGRKHHEIYLSDPRKGQPANLKTVLRHPVERR